jgi:hypothetical protein
MGGEMTELEQTLFDKYGPRLNTAELASVFKTTPDSVRTMISNDEFYVPVYRDNDEPGSRAPWFADVRDVADYLDRKRPKAAKPASQDRDAYNA